MRKEKELNVLRIFPYAVFAVIFSIMISISSFVVKMITGGSSVRDINSLNSNLYLMSYFILYSAMIIILSCLYQLRDKEDSLDRAYTMSFLFFIMEMMSFVVRWLKEVTGGHVAMVIISYLVSLLPTICIMLIVAFVLKSAGAVYKDMGRKYDAKIMNKSVIYWGSAFSCQIITNAILSIAGLSGTEPVLLGIIASFVALYSFSVMVYTYFKIKEFSFDYYLFLYNSSVTM